MGRSFTNESMVGGNACDPLSVFSFERGKVVVILIVPEVYYYRGCVCRYSLPQIIRIIHPDSHCVSSLKQT